MYQLVLAACIAAAGCTAFPSSTARDCFVYELGDDLTDGLVRPTEDAERELRGQLPAEARDQPLCWYQTPAGTLEAEPGVGYEFDAGTMLAAGEALVIAKRARI